MESPLAELEWEKSRHFLLQRVRGSERTSVAITSSTSSVTWIERKEYKVAQFVIDNHEVISNMAAQWYNPIDRYLINITK